MTPFYLATLDNGHGEYDSAIGVNGSLYSLEALDRSFIGKSVKNLLESWSETLPLLEQLVDDVFDHRDTSKAKAATVDVEKSSFVAPVQYPNKLLAVGANYTSHLKEMGLPVEKWDPMPFFSCPPTTSIVGPGKTVKYPTGTEQLDWEVELTVVLGRHLRDATVEEAREAIAGYTVGLDLSCRDLLAKGPLPDIMRGKAQDTMKPIGPVFVPKKCLDEANVRNLAMKLWVNGELMIDGNTSEMIWRSEECLAEISTVTSLEPGDLVMTGTPAGSAKSHGGRWLKVGDKIKAEIEQVGVLEVEIGR